MNSLPHATTPAPILLSFDQLHALLKKRKVPEPVRQQVLDNHGEFEVYDQAHEVEGNFDIGPHNVVVLGDLTVGGALTDANKSDNTFLLVLGTLRARSVASLSAIVVTQDLVADVVLGDSLCDHALVVAGDLRARAVINNGHHFQIGGAWQVPFRVASHSPLPEANFDSSTLTSVLVGKVLKGRQAIDLPAMVEELRAHRDVIRAAVAPRDLAVQKIIDRASTKGSPRSLSLSDKTLTEVPDGVLDLPTLQKLDLQHNELRSLPESLGTRLPELRFLQLSNNRLAGLPASLAQAAKLHTLLLSQNHLTQAPPVLARLSKLKNLSLSSNRMNHLPEELGTLDSLEWLDAGWNALTEVLLAPAPKLEALNLEHNRLARFPRAVTRFPRLTRLNFSWNQMSELPHELSELQGLTHLDLGHQKGGLPRGSEVIARLPALQSLGLAGLALEALPPFVMALKDLEFIDLASNPAMHSLPEAFFSLSKLKRYRCFGGPSDPIVIAMKKHMPQCEQQMA